MDTSKPRCRGGHYRNAANTYVRPSDGVEFCRACRHERAEGEVVARQVDALMERTRQLRLAIRDGKARSDAPGLAWLRPT